MGDYVIDATKAGNISRFINHSCDSNAQTEKWTVQGMTRIAFTATKEIQEGEEITFDYQFVSYGEKEQKCYCGTAKCRGVLGRKKRGDKNGNNKFHPSLDEEENSDLDYAPNTKIELTLESVADILKLVRSMHQEWSTDSARRPILPHIKTLFTSTDKHRSKLCYEYTRFQGLKILVDWYTSTEDRQIKMDILDIWDITGFKTQRPYIDSGILDLVQEQDPEMYNKFKMLPEGKNRFLKKFHIEEMLEREASRHNVIFEDLSGQNSENQSLSVQSLSPNPFNNKNKEKDKSNKQKLLERKL